MLNKGSVMSDTLTMYVYYKIPTNERAIFLSAVRNLNQVMKTHYPFLATNQQKRPELDRENKELWMETYHGIPNSVMEKFTMDLTLFAEQQGLPKERKQEIFISL